MTALACDACGRVLGGDAAFCPYCGAARRAPAPAPAASAQEQPTVAPAPAVVTPEAEARRTEAAPARPPSPAAPVVESSKKAAAAAPTAALRKRGGCGLPLLLALMVLAGASAWWAVRPGASRGALPVAGAVASRPLRLSRHWRHVSLPVDAPAGARFALSSDAVVRVRAAGRLYAVRPGRPLRLPEELGDGFDLRAPDYVSAAEAARAQVTLSTLPAPR